MTVLAAPARHRKGHRVNGNTVKGVIRSTFVPDEQGVVTRASYAVKATGHVAKLRRDLGVDAV